MRGPHPRPLASTQRAGTSAANQRGQGVPRKPASTPAAERPGSVVPRGGAEDFPVYPGHAATEIVAFGTPDELQVDENSVVPAAACT